MEKWRICIEQWLYLYNVNGVSVYHVDVLIIINLIQIMSWQP